MKYVKYKENDYFTKEYYDLLEKLDKNIQENMSTYKTFRENDDEAIYQSIAIEITQENHCQLSCKWCYINQTKRDLINRPISFEVVKDIIDKIVVYNNKYKVKLFSNIVLIGGEPTLNRDLDKMIDYSLENNINPILVSNGLRLYDEKYAKMICKKGVIVTTHLPFFKESDKYDYILDKSCKYTEYSEKLKKALDNMLEIKKKVKNFKIVGEMVLNKLTVNYAYESYVYCRENDIEPFFEFMRIGNEKNLNNDLKLSQNELKDFAQKVYQYDVDNNFVEKDDIVTKIRYYLPPAINKPCTTIQNSIHVKFTKNGFGDVNSCCGQDIIHGNIIINSLEEIISNKENTLIFSKQKEYIKGPCAVCELYSLVGCEGGCRGNAKNIYNCAEASDPQCIFIKEEIKEDFNIMCKDNCLILN